jgi:poly-gamma-glutamate synthesis protein (capsule biosynthesis protein)
LIDAGADVVFGHSGHVFQGIEIYRGRPILYCTGNFVDDYAVDEIERNDQSFVYHLEIEGGTKLRRLQLYPTLIREFQARLARGSDAQEIATKMQSLCAEFGTSATWCAQERYLEISISGSGTLPTPGTDPKSTPTCD